MASALSANAVAQGAPGAAAGIPSSEEKLLNSAEGEKAELSRPATSDNPAGALVGAAGANLLVHDLDASGVAGNQPHEAAKAPEPGALNPGKAPPVHDLRQNQVRRNDAFG